MTFELVYTSSPSGLVAGKSGFCTVAATKQMSANLVAELESLSGYRHVYSPGDPKNPVSLSYVQLRVAGKVYYVLSRVGDAGMDYSGRSNLLAHHIAIAWDDLPTSGPAWLADPKQKLLRTNWQEDPQYLPPLSLAQHTDAPTVCNVWKRLTGDAGWGGVPAQAIASKSKKPIAIVYGPDTDVFSLIRESSRLLPKNLRWKASYNTFFTSALPGLDYRWRCFFSDTPEAEAVRRDSGHTVIDLTDPASLRGLEDSEYVQAARTGVVPESATRESQHARRSKAARSTRQSSASKNVRAVPEVSDFEDGVSEELHLQPPGRKSQLPDLGFRRSGNPRKRRSYVVLASVLLISMICFCGAGLFIYFNNPELVTRIFDSQARELINLQDQLDALKVENRSDRNKNDPDAQSELAPEQILQQISKIKETLQGQKLFEVNENNKTRKMILDAGLDQLEIRTKDDIFRQKFQQIKVQEKGKVKKRLEAARDLRAEIQRDPLFEDSGEDESEKISSTLDSFIAQLESRLSLRDANTELRSLQAKQKQALEECLEDPKGNVDRLMDSMAGSKSAIDNIRNNIESLVKFSEGEDKRKRKETRSQLDEFNETLQTQIAFFSAIQRAASFDLPAELNITLVAYKNKIAERRKEIENLKNGLPESLSPEQAPKVNDWLKRQGKSLEQYDFYVQELEKIKKLLGNQPDGTTESDGIQSYVDQLKDAQDRINELQQDLQQLEEEGFQKLLVDLSTQAENSIKNYEEMLSAIASQEKEEQDGSSTRSQGQGWWTPLPEFLKIGPTKELVIEEDKSPKTLFEVPKNKLPEEFNVSTLEIELLKPGPEEISLKKSHAGNRATWEVLEDEEIPVAQLTVEEDSGKDAFLFKFGYFIDDGDQLAGKYKLQNDLRDKLAGHVLEIGMQISTPENRAYLILDAQSNGNNQSASKINFNLKPDSSRILKKEAAIYRANGLGDNSMIRLEIDKDDIRKVIDRKFKDHASKVKVAVKGGELKPIAAKDVGEDQDLGRLWINIETWGKPQFQFKVMGSIVESKPDTGTVKLKIWTEFEQIDFKQPGNISVQFEQTLDDVVGPNSTKFKDERVNKDARERIPLRKDGSSKRKNQAQYFKHALFLKSKKKGDIISELNLLKSNYKGEIEGVRGRINNLNSQDPPPPNKSERLNKLNAQVPEIARKIGAVDSTIKYVEETVPFLVDELQLKRKEFEFKMKVLSQYQFPNGQTRELQLIEGEKIKGQH